MRERKTSLKNINEVSYNETSMNRINDRGSAKRSCGKACVKSGITTEVADRKADILVDKFKAPQCRLFFLKCIYHLPESEIEQAVESAMRPEIKSHIRYFTVVAKQKLQMAGY